MLFRFTKKIRCVYRDLFGCAATLSFFIFSYRDVLFRGKTLSSASLTVGSLGFSGFPGRGNLGSTTWLDPGAPPWTSQPLSTLARKLVTEGHFPWWNPFGGFGLPLAGNPHAGVFDPTNWISWLFPSNLQWDVHLLVAYILGAFGTYYLVRVLGGTQIAASIASFGFIGLGHFVTYGNHPNPAITLCALPWMLGTGYQIVSRKKLRYSFGFAIAIYWCITAGFPETAFACMGVTGLFLIVLIIRQDDRRWLAIKALILGSVLGLLLATPFLLGLIQFIQFSFSTHEKGMGASHLIETRQAIPALMFPTIFGRPYSQYFNGGFQGVRDWYGCVIGILALIGSSSTRHKSKLIGSSFFFFSSLLILIYVYTNWLGSGVRDLPILEQVVPIWFLPIATFLFVICAAIGVDTILQRSINLKKFVISFFVLITFNCYGFQQTKKVLAGMSRRDLFQEIRFPLFILLFLILGLVFLNLVRNRKIRFFLLSILITTSITSELSHYRQQNKLPERRYPYVEPQWKNEVLASPSYSTSDRFFGETAISFPQTNAALELRDIRMLDAIYLDRYWNFIRTFVQPRASTRFVGGPYSEASEPLNSSISINRMSRLARIEWLLQGAPPFHEIMNFDNYFRFAIEDSKFPTSFSQKCVTLGQERLCGLFAHPPSSFLVQIPSFSKQFAIAFGLENQAYKDPQSDGVDFIITGLDQEMNPIKKLLTKTVDPKLDKKGWFKTQFQLSDTRIKYLRFETDARTNSSTDWANWGSLTPLENSSLNIEKYKLVESEATQISRFSTKAPVAFLVNHVVQRSNYAEAKYWLANNSELLQDGRLDPKFDPFVTGVIETSKDISIPSQVCDKEKIIDSEFDSNGTIKMTIDAKCSGLLVISESFYPGWRIKINGKSASIYPFDGVFISSVLGAGRNVIELKYVPSYYNAAKLSILLAIIIMFFVLTSQIISRRRRVRNNFSS